MEKLIHLIRNIFIALALICSFGTLVHSESTTTSIKTAILSNNSEQLFAELELLYSSTDSPKPILAEFASLYLFKSGSSNLVQWSSVLRLPAAEYQYQDDFLFLCFSYFDAFTEKLEYERAGNILLHCTSRIEEFPEISQTAFYELLTYWYRYFVVMGNKSAGDFLFNIISTNYNSSFENNSPENIHLLSHLYETLVYDQKLEFLYNIIESRIHNSENLETFTSVDQLNIIAASVVDLITHPDQINDINTNSETPSIDTYSSKFSAGAKLISDIIDGNTVDAQAAYETYQYFFNTHLGPIGSVIFLNSIIDTEIFDRSFEFSLDLKQEREIALGRSFTLRTKENTLDYVFYNLLLRSTEKQYGPSLPENISEILAVSLIKEDMSRESVTNNFPTTIGINYSLNSRIENLLLYTLTYEFTKRFGNKSSLNDFPAPSDLSDILNVAKNINSDFSLNTETQENTALQSFITQTTSDAISNIRKELNESDVVIVNTKRGNYYIWCLIDHMNTSCNIKLSSGEFRRELLDFVEYLQPNNHGDRIAFSNLMRERYKDFVDLSVLESYQNIYFTLDVESMVPWNAFFNENPHADFNDKNIKLLLIQPNSFSDSNEQKIDFNYSYVGIGDVLYSNVNSVSENIALTGFSIGLPLRSNLVPLPETQDEIRSIASNFPQEEVVLFFQDDAQFSKIFEPDTSSSRIFHFATHAVSTGQIGNEGHALALSFDPNFPRAQNLYDDRDFAAINLHSDLVVLSACGTAYDRGYDTNTLVTGLAKSFLLAGSDAVAASLWDLDSHSTVELMEFVSSGLADGLSVDAALSDARFMMSSNQDNTMHSWAGFVFITDRIGANQ